MAGLRVGALNESLPGVVCPVERFSALSLEQRRGHVDAFDRAAARRGHHE
jgi:hypothetical protein